MQLMSDSPNSRDSSPSVVGSGAGWSRKGPKSRLRDRLETQGEAALSSRELLQLVIYLASPKLKVSIADASADQAIEKFGPLGKVLFADSGRLLEVQGFDEHIILALSIVRAAALRTLKSEALSGTRSRSLLSTKRYLFAYHAWIGHELFSVVLLNQRRHVLDFCTLSVGTVDHVSVYPREVAVACLKSSAARAILVHNHPSGDPSPSMDDIRMTRQIARALEVIGVVLHDHWIIGSQRVLSFAAEGLLHV